MFLSTSVSGTNAVFSRYPLRALTGEAGTSRQAQNVLVETQKGNILLWNVHAGMAVTSGWSAQNNFVRELARQVSASRQTHKEGYAVIVLGDFNAGDYSENYRILAAQLRDVHWSVGQGMAFTFPNWRGRAAVDANLERVDVLARVLGPFIKIDHIFVSEEFTPVSSFVVRNGVNSDHYPLVADVMMR